MYEVKFNIVTPLWTGDSERKGGTVRETGIIGSLRWWYEILVRGLGGTACDPTNTLCNNDAFCDACSLFGCTGRSRKFKLEVVMPERGKYDTLSEYQVVGVRDSRKKSLTRRVSGIMSKDDSVTLKFIPLREIEDQEWLLLKETIKLIDRYGALGGRTAQGNGIIKVANDLEDLVSPSAFDDLEFPEHRCSESAYDLLNFVFCRYRLTFTDPISDLIKKRAFWVFKKDDSKDNRDSELVDKVYENWEQLWKNYGIVPIAFHLRDALRALLREGFDGKIDRHSVLGFVDRNGAVGSRVFVSHGYRYNECDNTVEIRMFGFLTCEERAYLIEQDNHDLLCRYKKYMFQNEENYVKDMQIVEKKLGENIIANMRKGGDR